MIESQTERAPAKSIANSWSQHLETKHPAPEQIRVPIRQRDRRIELTSRRAPLAQKRQAPRHDVLAETVRRDVAQGNVLVV